jgi:hypothetical protein
MLGCALDVQEKLTALHWAADKLCDGGHDNTCTARCQLIGQTTSVKVPMT